MDHIRVSQPALGFAYAPNGHALVRAEQETLLVYACADVFHDVGLVLCTDIDFRHSFRSRRLDTAWRDWFSAACRRRLDSFYAVEGVWRKKDLLIG